MSPSTAAAMRRVHAGASIRGLLRASMAGILLCTSCGDSREQQVQWGVRGTGQAYATRSDVPDAVVVTLHPDTAVADVKLPRAERASKLMAMAQAGFAAATITRIEFELDLDGPGEETVFPVASVECNPSGLLIRECRPTLQWASSFERDLAEKRYAISAREKSWAEYRRKLDDQPTPTRPDWQAALMSTGAVARVVITPDGTRCNIYLLPGVWRQFDGYQRQQVADMFRQTVHSYNSLLRLIVRDHDGSIVAEESRLTGGIAVR